MAGPKKKTPAPDKVAEGPAPTYRPSMPAKLGADRFEALRAISVRGAEEHNLKKVDLDIPRDRLVVITGLSGSGKSSLAFDTIFAEGQRKYMESLSAYARQFLDQLKKPKVQSIEGLPPTIAIEQRSTGHNPRSTVATSTEIQDYLRLLFARVGKPTCWHPTKTKRDGQVLQRCGRAISKSTPTQIAEAVTALPDRTKLIVLAPVVRSKKGHHREAVDELAKAGFARLRVNGQILDLQDVVARGGDNPLNLARYEKHDIEAVVDRLVIKENMRARLAESVQSALRTSEGLVIISVQGSGGECTDTLYSEHYACVEHPERALEALEPRVFSFNSHHGACASCHGLGTLLEFDDELVLPDPDKTIGRGGIAPWKKAGPAGQFSGRFIRRFCADFSVSRETPIHELSDDLLRILLHGTDAQDVGQFGAEWEGVIPMLSGWFAKTDSQWAKDFLHQFMLERDCPDCRGDRLGPHALGVYVQTRTPLPDEVVQARAAQGFSSDPHLTNVADLAHLDTASALALMAELELGAEAREIAEPIVTEVKARLGFLASVGLDYLSLDRRMATLSGGEAQRIRLATQVGSGIVGAAYVLDEPTIGLHARDNARLIRTLRHLADIGNTVLIVEHDEEMIRAADHVIDIGPGPGVHGGEVIAQGTVPQIEASPRSITGAYLSGRSQVPTPKSRRKLSVKKGMRVTGAAENNLKGINVSFPLLGLVVVTGVSGSGKSTLVNDILLKALKRSINGSKDRPGRHTRISGLSSIDRIIEVDQSAIGRTPRSNPATYTNVFDDIRSLFAQLPSAKARGYKPGRFSFNVKGGRCEACQGQGVKTISMHFLPDVQVKCEVCGGTRFNRETLDITYKDKHIADVLEMTVEDACGFFASHPKVSRIVKALQDVGLGYLTLGQPSTTLSGGEAQRVKLATELGKGGLKSQAGHTVYILDEPTTGLHFQDVHKLVQVLMQLVDKDNSVIVIEHNLDVIKSADWVIDLGPEGGDGGGQVVAEGPPETIAAEAASHTGLALRDVL